MNSARGLHACCIMTLNYGGPYLLYRLKYAFACRAQGQAYAEPKENGVTADLKAPGTLTCLPITCVIFLSMHADHKASHILSCIMHPQKGVAELRWQNWQTANSHESLNAHDATLSDVTQHRCRCTAAARCSESSAAVTDKAARAAYRVHVRPRTLWQQSHEHSGHSQRPPVSPFSTGCLFWQNPVVGACVRSFRTLYERIQGLSACLDSREPEHRDASNLLASPPRGLPRTSCRTVAVCCRSGDAADRQVTCGSTSCRWRRFVCVDAVIKNQGP